MFAVLDLAGRLLGCGCRRRLQSGARWTRKGQESEPPSTSAPFQFPIPYVPASLKAGTLPSMRCRPQCNRAVVQGGRAKCLHHSRGRRRFTPTSPCSRHDISLEVCSCRLNSMPPRPLQPPRPLLTPLPTRHLTDTLYSYEYGLRIRILRALFRTSLARHRAREGSLRRSPASCAMLAPAPGSKALGPPRTAASKHQEGSKNFQRYNKDDGKQVQGRERGRRRLQGMLAS